MNFWPPKKIKNPNLFIKIEFKKSHTKFTFPISLLLLLLFIYLFIYLFI
jgi:hypothetical protein